MKYKTIFGGKKVPAIWQGGSDVTYESIETQTALWKLGMELGCTAIDTSEIYGKGRSEILVGKTIAQAYSYEYFIATKVASENLQREKLIRACENSLRRLGIDCIDLYQIHWSNPLVPLDEVMDTMTDLKLQGKIRYIGVSNFTLQQIIDCNTYLNGGLATVQMEYNLLNRVCEKDIIPYCKEHDILFLAYSPLNNGNIQSTVEILKPLAQKYDKTISQLILNWIVSNRNMCAIVKTKSKDHLIENSFSTFFDLEEEDIQYINKAFDKQVIKLKPIDISYKNCVSGIEGHVPAYQSVEEAIENKFKLLPTPSELANEVSVTKKLSKPIFVSKTKDGYELVGGNIRYWAWVIAFGINTEIECIVINTERNTQ